jgi:hypothetical protein
MIRSIGALCIGLLLYSDGVNAATREKSCLRWLPCARYKRVQTQKHAAAVQAHVWHELLLAYIDQNYLLPQILRAARVCMQNPRISWAVLRDKNKQKIYGRYCENNSLETTPEDAAVAVAVDYEQYFFHAHGEWEIKDENAEKVTEMAALVLACICMYYPRMIVRFIKETAGLAALPIAAFISAYLIFLHTNTLAIPQGDQWGLWGLM